MSPLVETAVAGIAAIVLLLVLAALDAGYNDDHRRR